MRNRYLKALLPLLSMTTLGHADQIASGGEKPTPQTKEPHFFEYHNRVVLFAPLYQSYERIKPDAFYAGVQGYVVPLLNKGNHSLFADAELRMGYNFFFNGRDHFTPFAGVGYLQGLCRHDHHTRHRPGIVYGAMGFLYDHEFNADFNLGVSAQLLVGGPTSKKHFDWGSPVVGSDISLPITFRFGHHRHWDFRIEPFNIYLHGSNASQCYWGFRNTLGYRF